MLAAAPPKSLRVRRRTSTNTSVSPSRATRSSSPQRRRKLRSMILTPRAARNSAASASAFAPAIARAGRVAFILILLASAIGARLFRGPLAGLRGHDLTRAEDHNAALAHELATRIERQRA